MGETIAVLDVELEFHQGNLRAGLAELEAELKALNKQIDSSKNIEYKLKADKKQLQSDLAQAKRAVDDYQKHVDAADNKRSAAARNRVLKERKLVLESYKERIGLVDDEIKKQGAVTAALASQRGERNSNLKLAKEHVGVIDQLVKGEKSHTAAVKERVAEEAKGVLAEAKAGQQRDVQFRKDLQSWKKIQDQIRSLNKELKTVHGDPARRSAIEGALHGISQEAIVVRKRLQDMNHEVERVRVPSGVLFGSNVGSALRANKLRLDKTFGDIGRASAVAWNDSFRDNLGRGNIARTVGQSIVKTVGKPIQALETGFKGLKDARVNILGITTSIQGLVIGIAAFAPVLSGVVATLGSLVGFLGSAAGGFAGVALASSGFAAGLAGIAALSLPTIKQVGNLIALQKQSKTVTQAATLAHENAANALKKYGKDSKEYTAALGKERTANLNAASATQQLHDALDKAGPSTRKLVENVGKLQDNWKKWTDAARPAVIKTLSSGVQTLNSDMTLFGRNSLVALHRVSAGLQDWFRGLRSADAKGDFNKIFGNANRAIAPLMNAFGHIGTALRKVAGVASEFLPGLSKGFSSWAKGLEDGSKNTDNIRDHLHSMIGSMRELGHLASAGGGLLATFFGGGVGTGKNVVQDMIDQFNKWNDQLKANPDGLGNFFKDGYANLKSFLGVLKPVVSVFMQWVGIITPFATQFFNAAAAVARMVGNLIKMVGLNGGLSTLAATLGGFWAIGKIAAAAAAVARFTGALGKAVATGKALQAVDVLGAGPGGLARRAEQTAIQTEALNAVPAVLPAARPTRRVLGGASTSAEKAVVGEGEAAAKGIGEGVAGATAGTALFEGEMGSLATTVGVFVGAAALLLVGLHAIGGGMDNAEKSSKKWHSTVHDLNKAVPALNKSNSDLAQSTLNVHDAQKQLNQAKAHGTSDDQLRAQLQLNAAKRDQSNIVKQQNELQGTITKNSKDQLSQAQKTVQAFRDQHKTLEGGPGDQKKVFDQTRLTGSELKKYRQYVKDAAFAQGEFSRVQQQAALQSLNQTRALAGLDRISTKAASSFAKLSKVNQAAIATKYVDPNAAAKVATTAAKSTSSGISQTSILKVIADTTSATQAINRLQAMQLTDKHLAIIAKGGNEAVDLLTRVEGHKLTKKELHIAEQGGPALLALIRAIDGIKPKPKHVKIDQTGGEHVQGVAQNAAAAVASIPPSSSSVITVTRNNITNNIVHNITGKSNSPGAAANLHGAAGSNGEDEETPASQRAVQRTFRLASEGGLPGGNVRQGRKITGARLIVGEEPQYPEYVISTNPVYRKRNRHLVRSAATDLQMMAKGGHHAGLTGTVVTSGKKIPTINPYAVGIVDPAAADSDLETWRAEKGRRTDALSQLEQDQKDYYQAQHEKKDFGQGKKKHKSTEAKEHPQAYKDKMGKFTREKNWLLHGKPGDSSYPATVEMKTIGKHVQQYAHEDKQLHNAVDHLTHLQAVTQTDLTLLNTLTSKINASKSQKDRDAMMKGANGKNGPGTWMFLFKKYNTDLTKVKNWLGKQSKAAHALASLNPHNHGIGAIADAANNNEADIDGQIQDASQLGTQIQDLPATADQSLAEKIAASPEDKTLLSALTGKLAKDQATLTPDTGTATATHDALLADTNNINAFYNALIGGVAPAGGVSLGALTQDQINEAYGNITPPEAPGDTSGSNTGIDADTQAQLDQIKAMGGYTAAANAVNAAYQQAAYGPGDIGTGNGSGWNGGQTINVYTLHPGDPSTLTAIGDAATAGMGYQPSRNNPRLNTGL